MTALPFQFEVLESPDHIGPARRFPLGPGRPLSLGRRGGADIRLQEMPVSRRHCEVRVGDEGVWVSDVGSRNGTYANGVCLPQGQSHLLRPDGVLRVGPVELRLRIAVPLDDRWLSWQGGLVRQLARHIRQEGDFASLPVLADALEEAGCTEEALLAHCRLPADHAGGCWVLRLLLDRVAQAPQPAQPPPREVLLRWYETSGFAPGWAPDEDWP